jgi:exonuclease VII large subunit
MIKDEKLRKICFLAIIIGLTGMIAIGQICGPEKVPIGHITDKKIGLNIETSGTISAFSVNKDNHIFIDLKDDSGAISMVMFERTARGQKEVYNLSKGRNVTVIGKVALYKSELEIQADSIKPTVP